MLDSKANVVLDSFTLVKPPSWTTKPDAAMQLYSTTPTIPDGAIIDTTHLDAVLSTGIHRMAAGNPVAAYTAFGGLQLTDPAAKLLRQPPQSMDLTQVSRDVCLPGDCCHDTVNALDYVHHCAAVNDKVHTETAQ